MPPTLEELKAREKELTTEGRTIAEKDSTDISPEEWTKLRDMERDLDGLGEQIKELEKNEDAKQKMLERRSREDQEDRYRSRPKLYPDGSDGGDHADEALTPGEKFAGMGQTMDDTSSPAYRQWMGMFPDGGPTAEGVVASSNAHNVGNYGPMVGLRTATDRWRGMVTPNRFRALTTSADASAGLWVQPDRRGLIEPGLIRPLTIRQLVTVLPTASDAIEYIREATRIAAAAPVTEAVQLAHTGDVTATKPEGGLTFQTVADVVKAIAIWVPATNRILSDAPQLRAYIDQYLTDDIALELEDQMVSGTGGAGFTGLFNTTGTQAIGPPAGSVTELDLIRRAKRLVVTNARTRPTAVLVNPEDMERWDTLKDSQGRYLVNAGPQDAAGNGLSTVWGMPVIESEACPVGFALVGDFRRAILFDRQRVNISVGTANEDFIRNIVRILAEMRAGFGVVRPPAFVEVDLVA
jgi:HK97 family phage major capsid protein